MKEKSVRLNATLQGSWILRLPYCGQDLAWHRLMNRAKWLFAGMNVAGKTTSLF